VGASGVPLLRGPLSVPHGMTLRAGGVSREPFDSLNLGASVGDDAAAVATNRARVAATFGVELAQVMRLDQVHGSTVRVAGLDPIGAEGDAIISDDPDWLLAVSAADCLPVLLHDPRSGAVAAVHAGWRGAVAGVVIATIAAMERHYQTRPHDLLAWFGAGIRGPSYQVGAEVADAFAAAGAPAGAVVTDPSAAGRFRADVAALVRAQLERAGVQPYAIHDAAIDTFSDERCYSHRRDAGRTGRHWALVRAAPPGYSSIR